MILFTLSGTGGGGGGILDLQFSQFVAPLPVINGRFLKNQINMTGTTA